MKKTLTLIAVFTLALSLLACTAFASGEITVGSETFHIVDGHSINAYSFAKVENTGASPIEFSAGLFEVRDADGNVITSTDYMNCYPKYLQPGETGYVLASDTADDAESVSDIADHTLEVSCKSTEDAVTRYPATVEYQQDVSVSKTSTNNFVTAVITNDTDETVFNMEVVVVLLDDNDNILYMDHQDYHKTTGINAGSSVTYRSSISDDWYDNWEREGITPTHADVIAYSEVQDW